MEGLLAAAVALDDPENVVALLFGKLYYLYPILDLVAGILCLAYAGLSSRLILAGIGFLGEAAVFVVHKATLFFVTLDEDDHLIGDGFALAEGMFTVIALIFAVLVVVGLALAFVDLQRKLFEAKRTPPRRDEDEDSPRWQRR